MSAYKKKNIIYFLDYGQYFGGAVNTLLQQAILMKAQGNHVVLCVSDYYGNELESVYEEICYKSGLELYTQTFQICSHTEDIDIVCLLKNYEELKNFIIEKKADILHSVQVNPTVELISRELEIPHIMNIYQLLPDFFTIEYMNLFPHYHICDSEYYAKKWNHYLHTDSACIRTVVNTQGILRREILRNRTIKFICVGSVCEEKNQLSVIKAFHEAIKRGVFGKLQLFGYDVGGYAEKCKKYIDENKLWDRVVLKGFCDDMYLEYKNADVLICGSTRESYPNAISEAMANGLIVISTPVAGVPEVVTDRKNGYLCSDYSSEAILDKILEAYEDIKTGKTEEMLQNIYKTYKKEHSPEIVTEKLLEYYEHVECDNKKKDVLLINEVREKFDDMVSFYNSKYTCFSKPEYIERKLWYLYHVKDAIQEKIKDSSKSFYIWGTGLYGQNVSEMVKVFFPEMIIDGYIDTYREGEFLGKKVYKPKDIISDKNKIIMIAVLNGQYEILKQLEQNGKRCNKDYFILSARRW